MDVKVAMALSMSFREQWRRDDARAIQTLLAPGSATHHGDAITDGCAPEVRKKPKRRAPSRKLTEDEKVEKHRMIVRRAYYQKKATKARLEQQISALEEQFQSLLTQTQHGFDVVPAHCSACENTQCLRFLYRQVCSVKEALRQENAALEASVSVQLAFQDKLDALSMRMLNAPFAQGQPQGPMATPKVSLKSLQSLVTVETPDSVLSFQLLSSAECDDIARRAAAQICSRRSNADFVANGSSVMGWDRTRTCGTDPKFSLLKRFSALKAVELWNQTWRLYTQTELFWQLYSGTVGMRFKILQNVDADNVLFYRSILTKLQMRSITFFLFSRFQMDDGYVIIFRSVDPARIDPHHPSKTYLPMFSWMRLIDTVDDNGAACCEVEFGGHIPSQAVADADFWMMEFLSYLLRLEHRAIGPVFQLQL